MVRVWGQRAAGRAGCGPRGGREGQGPVEEAVVRDRR